MTSNPVTRNSTSQHGHRKSTTAGRDAVSFLTNQHRDVEELFTQFEKLGNAASPEEKEPIVRTACEMLSIHAAIEEEIFYPTARDVDDTESLLNQAEVEHLTLQDLVAELDAMDATDDLFAATFSVLAEYVKHHVKEEEGELFPRVEKSDLDLDALGEELAARAHELAVAQATP
jgi:hemerythrin superfamily protein